MDYNATLELDSRSGPELVDRLAGFAAAAAPTDSGRLAVTITLTVTSVRQACQLARELVDDAIRHMPSSTDPDLSNPDPSNGAATGAGEDLVMLLEVLPTVEYDARLGMAGLQEVLSVGETAAELGISEPRAVRQRLDNGTLAGRRAGRSWHVPREAVEAAKTRQQAGTRIRRRPAGGRTDDIDGGHPGGAGNPAGQSAGARCDAAPRPHGRRGRADVRLRRSRRSPVLRLRVGRVRVVG